MTDNSFVILSDEPDGDAADDEQCTAKPTGSVADLSPAASGDGRARRLFTETKRRGLRSEPDRARQPEDMSAETERPEADSESEELQNDADEAEVAAPTRLRSRVPGAVVYVLLPLIAMALAGGIAFIKYQTFNERLTARASTDSVQAAKDATARMLSYSPDTVDKDLGGASDLLTGDFRDSYTSLIRDVVIPGAKQQKISATATVPAAASVSASPDRAVVLVYVNQDVVVGNEAPTQTNSVIQVSLDRSEGRWLVSGFDPK